MAISFERFRPWIELRKEGKFAVKTIVMTTTFD